MKFLILGNQIFIQNTIHLIGNISHISVLVPQLIPMMEKI